MMGAAMRARHVVGSSKSTQKWWWQQGMVQGKVEPQGSVLLQEV